ncbi:MAG: glycosyltransferase family 4 protein, partial [Chloroflexi bacterium]|nr:glycosyltransferase family 4 protein [Chloroflexota bacterium]
SMTPLFPDRSMGGAQKQLRKVATFLAQQGHSITILCTARVDTNAPFSWPGGAQVLPVLPFKQPFPEPYATPAYNIATAIQEVGEHLRHADRFYSHDGGLIFPYIYQHIPTIISLRSVIFSETLQAGFLFQGDALILISQHARDYYQFTAGRFFPGYADRIRVIYNGFDWDRFKPTPPDRIRALFPENLLEHPLLLYPHRPEAAKGIWETLDVVDLLVHQHDLKDVRVLVPRWIDESLDPEIRKFYEAVRTTIAERNLADNFVFHDWIPDDLMPEYYSLGAVTLNLGSYVETFGNVPYESMGCGTRAILARVGPHRELLPEGLVDRVEFGDASQAATIAARIIRNGERTPAPTLRYLHQHFDIQQMVTSYAKVILQTPKRAPMPYEHRPISKTTRFRLAPWCYLAPMDIYHDFRGEYLDDAALHKVVTAHPEGFTIPQAQEYLVAEDMVMARYREGYLVIL